MASPPAVVKFSQPPSLPVSADVAALNGSFIGAESRDITAERMSPSQIEAAQKLVREFVRKKYKEC